MDDLKKEFFEKFRELYKRKYTGELTNYGLGIKSEYKEYSVTLDVWQWIEENFVSKDIKEVKKKDIKEVDTDALLAATLIVLKTIDLDL